MKIIFYLVEYTKEPILENIIKYIHEIKEEFLLNEENIRNNVVMNLIFFNTKNRINEKNKFHIYR